MRDQCVEGLITREPAGRGLRPHLRHTWNVVHRIPDEREIIDDLLGIYVELGLDTLPIESRVRHGVHDGDGIADELCHVLVDRRDDHAAPRSRCPARERPDHVVRLDALDPNERQPERTHDGVERFDLRAQVVRHRRSMRLVLLEQVIAECASRRVEHHRDMVGPLLPHELEQHVHHAVDGAGRLSARVGERRQRVECAVQVRGAVDQDESGGHRERRASAPH